MTYQIIEKGTRITHHTQESIEREIAHRFRRAARPRPIKVQVTCTEGIREIEYRP